jgi:hypothetical protein
MPPFLGAFPVLPGKEEQVRAFGKEVDRRMSEYDASEKRFGITKELVSLAASPRRGIIMMYVEAQDLEKAFTDFANSKDPFDLWLKNQLKELTGVDMGAPPSGPMPENLIIYGY